MGFVVVCGSGYQNCFVLPITRPREGLSVSRTQKQSVSTGILGETDMMGKVLETTKRQPGAILGSAIGVIDTRARDMQKANQ
jgi:hypothetical protein